MARRVSVELIDDIDGKSEAAETIAFGLDGSSYEIDLSQKNAEKLRKALSLYVGHARKVSTGGKKPRKAAPNGRDPAAIRAWATEHGVEVPARGRIPQRVVDLYRARA